MWTAAEWQETYTEDERKVIGFVPVHALTTIYYIVRKRGGKALADRSVDWILTTFRIARCGAPQFRTAQACEIDDFEDAVVAASAVAEKCSAIITRNTGHFASSPVPAVTPSAFHV